MRRKEASGCDNRLVTDRRGGMFAPESRYPKGRAGGDHNLHRIFYR